MKPEQRIQRFFSPLIIVYGMAVLAVLGFIIYVAFSKTTIIVTLAEPESNFTFSYSAEAVDGVVVTVPVVHNTIFTEYEGDEAAGIARGTVSIINNYSVDQPLVATTRLLSQAGVLFRTDETVTVPAGGSVTVPVYADQAGADGNIGPSKFEIVALWDGLKDNIYAESNTAMTGGVVKKVTVTEALAEAAEIQATDELSDAAIVDLQAGVESGTIDKDLIMLEGTKTVITPAVGATGDSISAQASADASTLVFDRSALEAIITADSPKADMTQLDYFLTRTSNGDLQISGSVPLPTVTPSLDFIDRANLTNKTPRQIQETLLSYEAVQSVEVQITPFWATRSPSLEQQIHLKMAEPASTPTNE